MRKLAPALCILLATFLFACAPALDADADESTKNGLVYDRTVTVGKLSREYLLHLPEDFPSKRPLPVVLVFHGGFGTPESIRAAAGFHLTRQGQDFAIVYARGYLRAWNAGPCCGLAKRRNIDDKAFVRAVLDDIGSLVPIDRRRVYATGFSNGAMLSYYLACTMSDEITAIATMGAAMQQDNSECAPSRPVPVFHLHGKDDKASPYEGGMSERKRVGEQPSVADRVRFWADVNSCREEKNEAVFGGAANCTEFTGCRDDATVRLCVIPNLGHHWPGARSRDKLQWLTSKLGPLGPPDLPASEAILDFFSQHAIP